MTKTLVVEDTLMNMELVLEILESQGFSADTAQDGEEAIKRTEKEIYDLVLMDIALPGIDGVEATKIIRKKPEYRKVPIVALTAFAMKGDREKLLNEGFDDYISKPIDVSEFIEKIKKYKR